MKPTILVATWADGLFTITDDQPKQEIANQRVRGLAADNHGGALAIVGQHSLRRRAPGGEWTTIATSDFELSCCMSVQDTIYVGTDDARLLRLSPESGALDPVVGFDSVAGRDTWFAGSAIVNGQRLGPPLGIRSLAANSNGILFANVHVGGIPRSLDGGTTWHPTIEINSDVHEVRAHPDHPDIVAAVAAIGLCISRDAGATWTIEKQGLHGLHCTAIAFSGDDIIFSAATQHFAAEGRIYRRPLNPAGSIAAEAGVPAGVPTGLPEWIEGIADTGSIAADASYLAVVDRAGNLYRSDNFGRTWSNRTASLPPNPSAVLIC